MIYVNLYLHLHIERDREGKTIILRDFMQDNVYFMREQEQHWLLNEVLRSDSWEGMQELNYDGTGGRLDLYFIFHMELFCHHEV